jgi:hypothetical protein
MGSRLGRDMMNLLRAVRRKNTNTTDPAQSITVPPSSRLDSLCPTMHSAQHQLQPARLLAASATAVSYACSAAPHNACLDEVVRSFRAFSSRWSGREVFFLCCVGCVGGVQREQMPVCPPAMSTLRYWVQHSRWPATHEPTRDRVGSSSQVGTHSIPLDSADVLSG